jgi:beta-phosphoglucomutase-like phosphatase (HAD superfamily)
VVIEDAISGVQAGRHGNFGLVIGVARKGNAEELRQHGAHLVVNDLGELVD